MIRTETQNKICKKAVKTYGEHSQMIKCIEECSELQRAISRVIINQPIDGREPSWNFNEELADLEIMLQQMKCTSYFDKEKFDTWKEIKLKKLEEKIS